MRRAVSKRVFLLLAAALIAPAAARANGFALDIQGLFSNGTASAGAAAARDPSGQFANPATLASLEGTQVVAGGMVIAASAPYTDGGSTMLGGASPLVGVNRDGAGTGFSPWVFASHRVSPELALGFAVTAPFGTATDYGRTSNFIGRYQGVESKIESIAFGPAVAWKPSERFAIGASVAARRDTAVIGQAFDLGSMCVGGALANGADLPTALAACGGQGLAPGASDGYGRISANGWGWTAMGGATFEPAAGTRLGIAYRYEFLSKVKGKESIDDLSKAVLASAGVNVVGEPGASIELPLPAFLTVSASHRLGSDLTLLAALQYTFWKRFDTIDLVPDDPANGLPISAKQGYRNAFRLSGGASWTASPWLEVFGGLAFEQSPITDATRSVTLPERDTLIVGLGGEARLGAGFTAGVVYQRVQMLGTSKIDQNDAATGTRVTGSAKGSANLAVLQLGWRG